jgi:peptidoglycan/LPS O-acetylase OafA/YrhL
MNYRRELDGLRAIAILPVILFHAGFEWFSGGFIGVDVFFVISGYLITLNILSEMEAGQFSLGSFYERRVRRILPALFFVLAACTVFALFFMLPKQTIEFSRGLVAIPLFSSNILFGLESNYFATAAELNPILHTWSLSVEEQFYVAFPLFMLLLWRFNKRILIGFLVFSIVGTISFILAELRSATNPDITFYLLRTRCWELLLGTLIAYVHHVKTYKNTTSQLVNQMASLVGLTAIVLAVLIFDKGTRFPSVYTLVPTVGASLIILFATPSTIVGRLLAHPWLVGIGLISFSAYLWHQPIFAFARILGYTNNWLLAMLAICSIILAYFTWRFIEQPFRDKRKMSRKSIFAAAFSINAVIIGTGMAININDGFPNRVSQEQHEVLAFLSYSTTELYRTGKCLLRTDQPITEFSEECSASGNAQSNILFLWGDSFAAHLYPAIKNLPHYAVNQYSSVCPPLIGLSFDYGRDCEEIEKLILAKIKKSQPSIIVLSSNWRKHKKYVQNIGITLQRLKAISNKSIIIVVGNVPQWEPTLPEVLARTNKKLQPDLRINTPLLNELRLIDNALQTSAKVNHVKYISPINLLCNEKECLAVVTDGDTLEPIAYDYGHLTKGGAILLVNKSKEFFQ